MSALKTVFITGASRASVTPPRNTSSIRAGGRSPARAIGAAGVRPQRPAFPHHRGPCRRAPRRRDRPAVRAARRRSSPRSGQQRWLLTQEQGRSAPRLPRWRSRALAGGVRDQLFRPGLLLARARAAPAAGRRRDRQHHLDRRASRPSVRRQRVQHLQGGAVGADARAGRGPGRARHPGQCGLPGRDQHRDPVAGTDQLVSRIHSSASARRPRWLR